LQVVIDALEEESAEDQDYYIDKATIEYMADGRLSDHLLNLLRGAMGSSDGIEIRWQRR
jgi:processive 1,2-diacylglycerol beta-glucosyltransferase